MDVDAAFRAAIERADGHREEVAAAGAAKHLVRRHEVRSLGSALVLKHATRRALARRRLGTLRALRPALPRAVLVAALTVLAVVAQGIGSKTI